MRNSWASRRRSMMSSPTRRLVSVSWARARRISAIARARDTSSGTGGLGGGERSVGPDMVVLPAALASTMPEERQKRHSHPELRVEIVAQPVAEQVDADHRERDGEARDGDEPPGHHQVGA